MTIVSPLAAISPAWTSAEASLPHGWQLSGLYRFEDLWGRPAVAAGMAHSRGIVLAHLPPLQVF